MQKNIDNEKVCAAVRILPSEHPCDNLCDFDVVSEHHPSFRASMLIGMLDQIKDRISEMHGEGISITQITHAPKALVTLTYEPAYFNVDRPFQEFVLWIEGLWRRGLADFHQAKRDQIRSSSQC
jgi:hypothetical protein